MMIEVPRRFLSVLILVSVFPLYSSFYRSLKATIVIKDVIDIRLCCQSAPNMNPEQEPRSIREFSSENVKRQPRNILRILSAFTLLRNSWPVRAADTDTAALLIEKDNKIATYNLPSDDFWYPPYMIGRWNTSLTFNGATFSKRLSLEQIVQQDAAPGFRDLSVIFVPQMGRDVHNVTMRFVQVDSHTREDHPHNIKQLVQAFSPDIEVTSAPYHFQKAADWFHSEANRWRIEYRNISDGVRGAVELFTKKRNINVFAGNVETTEFFTQTRFPDLSDRSSQPQVGDFAVSWKLTVPASAQDEFITAEDLRRTDRLEGQLRLLVYLRPTHALYTKTIGGMPVGVFTYNVSMNRIGDLATETARSVYPFVYRFDGPVELDKYFGY